MFCKSQKTIWLIVINKMFKFPPQIDPFFQLNFLLAIRITQTKHDTFGLDSQLSKRDFVNHMKPYDWVW